ncbi:DEKNAAC102917 [Brettanomyces naardenensis]|uniref:DEKNAAC102917 n=1 Tax=Brettanomyces naardenensis TaxID=13370 RepID=A0A448YM10_BRENA|nr:DEKNAAC102917 [Brettanomyces naardenensis]
MSLPALSSDITFNAVSKFSEPVVAAVEPVGQYFLAHATRTLQDRTWSEYERIKAEKASEEQSDDADDSDDFDEVTDEDLLKHDPRDWKTCDLYAVLGLNRLRYRATSDQIDRAYRKQVLTFHPDKQGEKGGFQDGFFKIIQKAYETLTDPTKRRQFESVDEAAEVKPPSGKYEFFEAWVPVFSSEARFSTKQPVPELGDKESSREQVEDFYKFWNNFDSWRSFEFLDEDVPDDTSNRDHKRYIEKKNNNARRKRKTEDNKRLSDLVKKAHSEDPRIKAFKQAEKEEKARKKWEREAGARQAAEEAKAKAEAEAKAKADADAKAHIEKAEHKKSKEAIKSAKKKSKRGIRNAVKESKYFGDDGKAALIDADIETLLGYYEFDELVSVAEKVEGASPEEVKNVLQESAKKSGKTFVYF